MGRVVWDGTPALTPHRRPLPAPPLYRRTWVVPPARGHFNQALDGGGAVTVELGPGRWAERRRSGGAEAQRTCTPCTEGRAGVSAPGHQPPLTCQGAAKCSSSSFRVLWHEIDSSEQALRVSFTFTATGRRGKKGGAARQRAVSGHVAWPPREEREGLGKEGLSTAATLTSPMHSMQSPMDGGGGTGTASTGCGTAAATTTEAAAASRLRLQGAGVGQTAR